MASGKLGSAAPAANTNQSAYTVPADTVATLNISVANRGLVAAKVRIAVSPDGTPADEDFIEYDVRVPGRGGVLERCGVVCGAGEVVVVRDDRGTCSYRVHGFERPLA